MSVMVCCNFIEIMNQLKCLLTEIPLIGTGSQLVYRKDK